MQVGAERQESFQQRQAGMLAAEGLLDRVRLTATAWKRAGIPIGDGGGWHTAAELLARTEITVQQVIDSLCSIDESVLPAMATLRCDGPWQACLMGALTDGS